MDTAAIQKAIDSGASQGGATVRVPAGKYLVGTIQLKSHVTLDLEREAVLLGSTRAEDYPALGEFRDGLGTKCNRVLISARNVQDVGISGQGVIDGQGPLLQQVKPRPFLVRFHECEGVKITGVTLTQSAMWTCHLWSSSNVTIEGVTILKNPHGGNNDGIDIDASSDVTISNCRITSGDDAICFKATVNKPCRRVTVTGCTFDTNWNGFKIGTESIGDFEDITMRDCVFERAASGGIRIFSVDGANIRNILVENITLKSVNLPVFIRLGARLKSFREDDQAQSRPVGTISNVVLRGIHGSTHGLGAIFITGIPGHPVRGVRIENLDCTIPGGDDGGKEGIPMVEKERSYPEPYTIYGPLPAYGIVLRHVEDCTISKLAVTCEKPDLRHAVACLDVNNIQIDSPLFKNPASNPSTNLLVKDSPPNAVQWIGTEASKPKGSGLPY